MTKVDIDRFDHQLALVGSENRAAALVAACREATDVEARELLAHWFNMCDALAPQRDELLEQFRRVGFVADTEAGDVDYEWPLTVYRAAWADDDPRLGLSWTTSLETARFFARYLTSMRAMFLGIRRDDVDPVIWQAEAWSLLAAIDGRNEHEVVPDPDELEMVQVISVLTSQKGDGDGS